MSDLNAMKDLVKAQIREQLVEKIRNVVHAEFPEVIAVSFSTNVEYYDQDDDYYDGVLGLFNADGEKVVDFLDYEENELYERGRKVAEELQREIDYNDFVFVHGFDGYVIIGKSK